jgi:hypothetical protein
MLQQGTSEIGVRRFASLQYARPVLHYLASLDGDKRETGYRN